VKTRRAQSPVKPSARELIAKSGAGDSRTIFVVACLGALRSIRGIEGGDDPADAKADARTGTIGPNPHGGGTAVAKSQIARTNKRAPGQRHGPRTGLAAGAGNLAAMEPDLSLDFAPAVADRDLQLRNRKHPVSCVRSAIVGVLEKEAILANNLCFAGFENLQKFCISSWCVEPSRHSHQ